MQAYYIYAIILTGIFIAICFITAFLLILVVLLPTIQKRLKYEEKENIFV